MEIKDLYRDRRVLSYGGLALVAVLMMSITASMWLSGQFGAYMLKQQQAQRSELASLLSQQYNQSQGWDSRALGAIGINSLHGGMIIKIVGPEGNVLWDARLYNNWLCEQIITHHREITPVEGAYVVQPYPLISGSALVGTVEIGYYGPYYFSRIEADFLRGMHLRLFGTSLALLLLTWAGLWFVFPGEKEPEAEFTPWYKK